MIDDYTENFPVSCLLYYMRNALCHKNLGFLPITSPDGNSEITDIIFRNGRGRRIDFMMVLTVDQLERLARSVAGFYSDIENGKASSNNREYVEVFSSIERVLKRFIGEDEE
jgi:hypothetical protein